MIEEKLQPLSFMQDLSDFSASNIKKLNYFQKNLNRENSYIFDILRLFEILIKKKSI